MFKRSKLVTLLCIVILGVVGMLSVTLISILPQLSGASGRKLTFVSGDGAGNYDGGALKADEWELISGSLKPGHTAEVDVKGTQKNVGSSENYFTVKIKDENGSDVTDEYEIELRPGKLTVLPLTITVASANDAKVYDGTPLTNSEFTVTPQDAIPEGFTIDVTVTGQIIEIGETRNTITGVHIYNQNGKDVTYNFDIAKFEGKLTVAKDAASLPGGSGTDVDVGELLEGLDGIKGEGPALDLSGNIGLPENSTGAGLAGQACYILNTNRSGKVYLKILSFGNYVNNSWETATPYSLLIDGKSAASYLASLALANSGAALYSMSLTPLNKQLAMPYFAVADVAGKIELSDTYVGGVFEGTVSYSYYDHADYSSAALPQEYEDFELTYRSFVYQNYLEIDSETRSYMNSIIASEGFSRHSPTIIKDVEAYVSTAAAYSLEYDRALDSEDNVAIAFLRDYKEGVCQHYATAATLLYRALGIPARYTIGFSAKPMANVDCQVSSENAHAWVEIYVDGIGWVMSEVTGGYYNNSDISGEETPKPTDKNIIIVKPQPLDKLYDGTPLTATEGRVTIIEDRSRNTMSNDEFALNYRYEAVIEGERTEYGKSVSRITSFRIYDKYDNDVTDNFKVETRTGELQVYINPETLIFTSSSRDKTYDGTPLVGSNDDVFYISGVLEDGHTYVARSTAEATITKVGQKSNDFEVIIRDENGNDITDWYKLRRETGMLTVSPRNIEITAGSATKVYDGTPLVCDEATITDGDLVAGDRIVSWVINDSQTNPGTRDNMIEKIKIVNSKGEDVTSNYKIVLKSGKLTVTFR